MTEHRGRPKGGSRSTGPRDSRNGGSQDRSRRGPQQGQRHGGVERREYRGPSSDPARRLAYDVMHEVGSSDAYATLVLPRLLRERRLPSQDAAFATNLVLGTIRWQGTWDHVLAECVDRPLIKLNPQVRDLLRLGTHQILMMRVPDHAAVSETVTLTTDVAGKGPASLVNAVLRKVAAHDLDGWRQRIVEGQSRVESLSREWSHPTWIIDAFRDALAASYAKDETVDGRPLAGPEGLVSLLAIDNEPPSVTLVSRRLGTEPRGAEATQWSPIGWRLESGDPANLPQIATGTLGVQDEASQLIALGLANTPLEGKDEAWLDLCAGPGGKAAVLAAQAELRGARLTASDLHAHRVELMRHALGDFDVELVQTDGRDGPWSPGSFDRILLDAPCTGLGVLRRRPEARWRRQPSDVSALAKLQRELLAAAVSYVRVGGVIAYVTCSPHIAETELVVEDAVRKLGVEVLDAQAAVQSIARTHIPALGSGPHARFWPHVHGTDGMFFALLRRTA